MSQQIHDALASARIDNDGTREWTVRAKYIQSQYSTTFVKETNVFDDMNLAATALSLGRPTEIPAATWNAFREGLAALRERLKGGGYDKIHRKLLGM